MTITARQTPTISATGRITAGFRVLATAARAIVKTALNRRRVHQLADMPDYVLNDIGIRRDDISLALGASWREDPSYKLALIAAAEATTIAILIGVPIGLFIGYRGGWWDWAVMRIVEAIVSIPGIMVAIVIIAILGPGLHRAMIALGILFSTSFLRLARGVVLAEREEVYVRSARVIGASDSRILFRHIFPNIAPPLIVQVTLTVGAVLLSEAGLSFIGLGVQPPQASWGTMLNTAAAFMQLNWFLSIPSGIARCFLVSLEWFRASVVRTSASRNAFAPSAPSQTPNRGVTSRQDDEDDTHTLDPPVAARRWQRLGVRQHRDPCGRKEQGPADCWGYIVAARTAGAAE